MTAQQRMFDLIANNIKSKVNPFFHEYQMNDGLGHWILYDEPFETITIHADQVQIDKACIVEFYTEIKRSDVSDDNFNTLIQLTNLWFPELLGGKDD